MTVVSLFSGIGGFELGLEPLGFEVVLQVEKDPFCIKLLESKWPDVRRIRDVREVQRETATLVCGGDPCPSRSLARGGRPSAHPDLAGYFLAVVGRSRPRWVVRENVPAPDVVHFAAGLEALGYGVVAIVLNARDFTGQSRRRQFVISSLGQKAAHLKQILSEFACSLRNPSQNCQTTAHCLTAHSTRLDQGENFVWEEGRGLRLLTCGEREALQGFPRRWTDGFSQSRRRIMLGRAVPPPMINWIGKRILEAENAT